MVEEYVNEYTMNKKYINEYVFLVLCKPLLISGILIGLFGILFFLIVGSDASKLCLFGGLMALTAGVIAPFSTSKEIFENSKRLNSGRIKKTKVVFKENIVMDEGKAHLEFDYQQINKIVKTKNFIVLKLAKNSAILVFKDGFVKGNQNSFINFIESKK